MDKSISLRLKEIREELFGSRGRAEMARFLELSQPAYLPYERAGAKIPHWVIAKLAEKKSVNPLYLLTGKGEKYLKPIGAELKPAPSVGEAGAEYIRMSNLPILSDEIAAGTPREIEDCPAEDFFTFQARWLHHPKDTFALKVRGDSMEPEIANGSWVLVDVKDQERRPGVIYAIRAEGGCVVRRLYINGDVLNFFPLRPSAENKFFSFKRPTTSPIIGRVVWVFKKL